MPYELLCTIRDTEGATTTRLNSGPSRYGLRPAGFASYILRDIEREWSTELGPKRFAQLKELLLLVWEGPLVR